MNQGLAIGLIIFTSSSAAAMAPPQEAASIPGDLSEIEHEPAPCMDSEDFPLIEARAATLELARSLRGLTIRFKAEEDTGWYDIAFRETTSTVLQVALPKPLPETARVAYYFATSEPQLRSREYLVPVLMGGCPGARSAPAGLTDGLRVRRTSPTQAEFPAGFSQEGVRAGGSWSKTTLGVVAAGAGGAGVAALLISGDEAPPNVVVPPEPGAIRACFTPDPIPDISSGQTILFDASCSTPSSVTSYQWNFGDGTTAQGSSVEHLFTPGSIYSVTLTVSDGQRSDSTSRVVRVLAIPSACFITSPNPPRIAANESINFNAECSVGDRDGGSTQITSYAWDFGDGRPGAEGVFVSRQFPQPDVYGVRLTVTNADGRQNTNTQFVVVESLENASHRESRQLEAATVTSHLEFADGDGQARGQATFNRSESRAIVAGPPRRISFHGQSDDNLIEFQLVAPANGSGRLRFDFSNTPGFVPGSLGIESGDLLTVDSHSVTLHLSGEPGANLRLHFRLEE